MSLDGDDRDDLDANDTQADEADAPKADVMDRSIGDFLKNKPALDDQAGRIFIDLAVSGDLEAAYTLAADDMKDRTKKALRQQGLDEVAVDSYLRECDSCGNFRGAAGKKRHLLEQLQAQTRERQTEAERERKADTRTLGRFTIAQ